MKYSDCDAKQRTFTKRSEIHRKGCKNVEIPIGLIPNVKFVRNPQLTPSTAICAQIGRSEQPQQWLGRDAYATDRIVQDHTKSLFFLDDPKAQ